jgi:hypothetical protein
LNQHEIDQEVIDRSDEYNNDSNNANDANNEDVLSYARRDFMTESEKSFFDKLSPLKEYGINIIPQVTLASVIEKKGYYKWQNELYRIIDFGIFDSEYVLLLLVELNDSSHRLRSRYLRDQKVRRICATAGIELLTFHTDKLNHQDYVLHRISKSIKDIRATR